MPETSRIAEVDTELFGVTVVPQLPGLMARARQLAGGEADAQDLVQETMERALRTFPRFRPGSAVGAWLMTIMRSAWIDGWRRRSRGLPMVWAGEVDAPAPDHGPPPLYELADVIVRHLPEAIATLPPKLRTVVELRLVRKWSYRAIAAHLGVPPRTVGTRLLRARRQLAEIIEGELPRYRDEARLDEALAVKEDEQAAGRDLYSRA
jgi:RNA polymerase sigma-70 factor (ECF subfamily)